MKNLLPKKAMDTYALPTLLLFITLFLLLVPIRGQSQTIFDLAVQIDSLYDKVKVGDAAAAKKIYHLLPKSKNIITGFGQPEYIGSNAFSHTNTETIYKLYLETLNEEGQAQSKLWNQIDSLKEETFSMLQQADSVYVQSTIDWVMESGGGLYNAKEVIMEDVEGPYPDSIRAKKDAMVREMQLLKNQIDELQSAESGKVNLIQEEEALDLMPIGVENTASLISPIIIQNQGGGSAQSAIIDGTAKWLAERMRQELSMAFFDRFESWAEKKNIDLLFSNTLSVLKSSATTDYTLMMEVYKRAFKKDLNQLAFNIAPFLENEMLNSSKNQKLEQELEQLNYQLDLFFDHTVEENNDIISFVVNPEKKMSIIQSYKDQYDYSLKNVKYPEEYKTYLDTLWARHSLVADLLKNKIEDKQKELNRYQAIKYLSFSLNTMNNLKEGQHPSELINSLYIEVPKLFPQNDRVEPILLLLHVISQSLIATNEEQNTVWIGKEALMRLSKEPQLQKIYFGLIIDRVDDLMNQKKQATVYNRYDDLSDPFKERIDQMKKDKQQLFYSFWDHFYSEYDPIFEKEYYQDPENYDLFIDKKIESFKHPSLDSLRKEEKKEILMKHFELLKNAKKRRSLVVLTPFLKTDEERKNAIINLLRKPEDENIREKMIFLIYGLARGKDGDQFNGRTIYFRPNNFNPFPNSFYPNINDDIEDTKADYFAEWGDANIKELLKPDIDTISALALIDSLMLKRMEHIKDFFGSFGSMSFEYSMQRDKNNIWDSQRRLIVEKDSLAILNEFKDKDNDYIKLDAQKNHLRNQSSFLKDFMNNKNKFGKFFSQLTQYTHKIDQINSQFKELRSSDKANFGNSEFIYLIKNAMGILDLVTDYTVDQTDPEMVRNMEIIQLAKDNLLEAYIATLEEDYNGLVMNIIPVVERLITNKYDKLIAPLENDLRSRSSNQQQLMFDLLPRSPALDSLRQLRDDKLRKMQEVFKYCTFVAAVAKSNNSDDVKKAINAIALPVGSYSIKRRTFANISLNAYPGITGGFELIQNSSVSEWAPNFGFTAPIGIGINWGYRSKINKRRYLNKINYRNRVQKAEVGNDDRIFNGHSGSIFFSFVDLGALVLFRLNDDNQPLPEDVGLRQIFSPGVSYVHGLPRVPISIMAGVQITPDLRKVGDGDSANSIRFNLSAVVDLPIANFYTKRRAKIKTK